MIVERFLQRVKSVVSFYVIQIFGRPASFFVSRESQSERRAATEKLNRIVITRPTRVGLINEIFT